MTGEDIDPIGGLFWDGRADTLAQQALGPFLNAKEMNNPNAASVVTKIAKASYAKDLIAEFGPNVFNSPELAFQKIGVAIAAFESRENPLRFSSKYDYFIQGKVQLTASEGRGLKTFMDPARGIHAQMGLLDDLPPSASVEALEASEALLVPETVFKQHLMEDPHMTIAIIRALVHRLREADRKIESLALLDVYGRIARLFLDLSKDLDGVRVIQQAPPKQEIARQIGASREMVSRVVRHLEESGTILVQKRKVTLLKAFRVS